jgi:hypothetical protein
MPITGYTLYPFQWHYRRDINLAISTTTGRSILITRVPPMPLAGAVPVGSQPVNFQYKLEPKPAFAGTYYGELSPKGAWIWNGTGRADDAWVDNAAKK